MLLYMLPFVILLIVAIILKKREASKTAEPSKKPTPAKLKAKPANNSELELIEPVLADPTREQLVASPKTELAPELRRHIQNQMRDGNYFAAEAQINQALNRDNGQHELYLMLLDLHLLQNDEFAVNQLFIHLRALQLDDILKQAQEKRALHEEKLIAEAKAKADAKAAQFAANSLSFEQLQEQVTQKTQAPLEFKAPQTQTVSDEQSITAAEPAAQISKPLSASFATTKAVATEVKTAEVKATTTAPAHPTIEAKPLEFSFSPEQPKLEGIEATQPSTQHTPTQPNSLDFTFTPKHESVAPTQPEPAVQVDPALSQTKKEFDFNFSSEIETAKPKAELEFNLEQEPVASPKADFNLDPTANAAPVKTSEFEFKLEQPKVQPTPKTVPAPSIEKAAAPASQPQDNDPLLQLFPALGQVNEADLNLRLASEYIRLGAYQDAKALLQEQESQYNEQQRQIATALRNKIA